MAFFSNLPQLTSFFSGKINTSNFLTDVGIQKQISYAIKLTDLTITYKIRDVVLQSSSVFYPYTWKDGDRPDSVAAKYYGDSKYWWVVFYSNKSFNLYYDFCMDQDQFMKYLLKKYVGMVYPPNTITIPPIYTETWQLTPSQKNLILSTLQTTIKYYTTTDALIIDSAAFATGLYVGATPVSIYDFEVARNEKKRFINLLDRKYVNQIQSELDGEIKVRRARGR